MGGGLITVIKKDEDERVNDDVREWLEPNKNELILGDFNLHAKEWSDMIDRRENSQAKDGCMVVW